MKLFRQYLKEVSQIITEAEKIRKFNFEEFYAGTAEVEMPDNIPSKGSIVVPVTEKIIKRLFLKDPNTGETRMVASFEYEYYDLDIEYEVTTHPLDGPRIKNTQGKYVQHLKLRSYKDNLPLIARPPRIKKMTRQQSLEIAEEHGDIEEEFDRSKIIIMDGKNEDRIRISNTNIIYFSNKDLESALKKVTQKTIQPKHKPPDETLTRGSDYVMSTSEIYDWAINEVAKTIKRTLEYKNIKDIKIKKDVVIYINEDGEKKGFKIIPPSPSFNKKIWNSGQWKIITSDNQKMVFMTSIKNTSISEITTGILPNSKILQNQISKLV